MLGDLPDPAPAGDGQSSWLPAAELRGVIDANFGAASLRISLVTAAGPGHDTVYFFDDTWQVSKEHWALLAATSFLLGPSARFPAQGSLQGVVSASAGLMALGTFHDFGAGTQVLLDPAQNQLDNPDNIDPYTLQAVPAFDLAAGIRVGKPVALTIDLGYTAAHVPAAGLEGAPSEAGAGRTALALDAIRLAVGVTVPLSRAPGRTSSPPESPQ